MDTIIPAQNENFRRRKRAYESFSSRRKSRKSFTLTIHWNLAKRVNYHGIIVHQHLTDRKTDGIAERAVRRIRKGRLLCCRDRAWMKTQYERRFGEPFKGPIMPFGARFLRETSPGSTNSVRKFYLEYSSDMYWSQGEFGKEILWLQTLRSWKILDASEIHARRVNAKAVMTPHKSEHSIFPFAEGTVKLSGRDHEFREPTLRREQPERSEDLGENFKDTRRGLNRPKRKMTLKPEMTFGQWKVTSFIVITSNLEFNSCWKEKHSQYHWSTLTWPGLHTTLDVMQESRIDDNWNIHGDRNLSEPWTRVSRSSQCWGGYMSSGERLTKVQATTRPEHVWPENSVQYV